MTKHRKLISKSFILRVLAYSVFANGALIVYDALLSHLIIRLSVPTEDVRIGLTSISGLSLIYLSTLLVRRKKAAWVITIALYSVLLIFNIAVILSDPPNQSFGLAHIVNAVVIPIIVVGGLAWYHREFKVKSDIRSFALSLRVITLILLVAFIYGVAGLQILDKKDFHQEINLIRASHYTIDQFGLTTDKTLQAYTKRADVFLFSLSLVSSTSLIYAGLSLFQPLRARYSNQSKNRIKMARLLDEYGGSSEDIFKIWPKDKVYIFNKSLDGGLAFRVQRGVALVVGDPAGTVGGINNLISQFHELCKTNDWLPAFIHTEPKWSNFFLKHHYSVQKIGEEAILDLETFQSTTSKSKYFREINNRFQRLGYRADVLLPPHSDDVITHTKQISESWLKLPGRVERGFMMGYFDETFIQQCPLIVARDERGKIQGFLNQIPSYDPNEANYDLLRQAADSPGNINDYILLNFINYLAGENYQRLNLGLCPLAGLDNNYEGKTVIDNALSFVYSNGDRFYSFSGLRRFKAKYEPAWQNRFIAYRGGIRNFTRTVNALNRAMARSPKNKH